MPIVFRKLVTGCPNLLAVKIVTFLAPLEPLLALSNCFLNKSAFCFINLGFLIFLSNSLKSKSSPGLGLYTAN
jgi:hypothetical protein